MKIITAYDLGAEIARRQVAVAKTAADLGAIAAVKQAAGGGLGGFGPKPPSDPSGAQKRRSELGGFPPPPPGPSAEQAEADAQKRRGQIGNSPSNTPGNTPPPPPPPTPKPQPGQGGFQNPITNALGQIGAGTNNAIDQFTNKIRESAAKAQAPQPQPGAAPQQPSAELLRQHPELAQTGQQQVSAQVPQRQPQPQTYNGQPMVYPGGQQQVEFSNFGGKPRYTHPIDMNNPVNQFHMQAAETRRQQLQPFLMPYEEGTVPPMPGTDYVPPTTEAFRRSSPPAGGASRSGAGGLGGAAGSAVASVLPQPTQQTSHPRLRPRSPAGQAPAPAAQAPAPDVKAPAPEVQTPAPKPTYDANDPNLLEGKTPEEIASLRQGVNADMYPPEQPKPAPTPPDYGPKRSPKAYAEQQKQRKEVENVGPFPGDAGNSTPYPGHPDYDTTPAEPVDFDRLPADDLNPNHRNNPNHPDFVGPQDPVGPPAAVAPPRATGQDPLRVPPRDIFKDLPTADDFRPDPNLPAPTETQKAFDGINPFADSILPPQTAKPPAEAPPAEAPPSIQGQALPPSQYQQRYAPPQQNPYFSPPQPQPQQRRGLFGRRR